MVSYSERRKKLQVLEKRPTKSFSPQKEEDSGGMIDITNSETSQFIELKEVTMNCMYCRHGGSYKCIEKFSQETL
jgi:hypothetical protein